MGASRATKNVAITAGFRVIAATGSMGASILLARFLSPSDLGAALLVISLVSLIAPIANGGTGRAIVRLVVNERLQQRNPITYASIPSALLISLCMAAFVVAAMTALGASMLPKSSAFLAEIPHWPTILTTIVLASLSTLFAEALRGMQRTVAACWISGASFGTTFLLLLSISIVLLSEISLTAAVRSMCLAYALTAVSGLWLVLNGTLLSWRPRISNLAQVARASFPLMATGVVLTTLVEIHTWVLAQRATLTEVGCFGLATRTVVFLTAPATIVASGLSPSIAELWRARRISDVETLMQRWATITGTPVLGVLLAFVLFAPFFSKLIYGNATVELSSSISILSSAYFISTAIGLPGMLLVMTGNEQKVLRAALVAGVCGLVTTFALARSLGAIGASLGVTISVVVHNYIMWATARDLDIRTEWKLKYLFEFALRLRRAIEFFALRKKGILWLETLLRRVEQWYWATRGLRIVEVFGDSHAAIFRRLNDTQAFPSYRFRSISVQGATAYSLVNASSSTGALKQFQRFIAGNANGRILMTLAGEVDVGYLAWKKAASLPDAMRFVDTAIGNYISFLENSGWPKGSVWVVSIPLATVPDEQLANSATRADLTVNFERRFELCRYFNKRLREEAELRGFRCLYLDYLSLEPATQTVKASLLNKNRSDHHYDPDGYLQILTEALHESGWDD